jgi:hypothetical protein
MFFLLLVATLRLDLAPQIGAFYTAKEDCIAGLREAEATYADRLKDADPSLGLKFVCVGEVK